LGAKVRNLNSGNKHEDSHSRGFGPYLFFVM
jgi:hypothetical protein